VSLSRRTSTTLYISQRYVYTSYTINVIFTASMEHSNTYNSDHAAYSPFVSRAGKTVMSLDNACYI